MINWFEVALFFVGGLIIGFVVSKVIDEWSKSK